jgi:phosphoglycolate phosphatase-like HAD superfamily hydrolase
LLWDIDGTLVHNAQAGSVAMDRTFSELFDLPRDSAPLAQVDFAGASDHWIVRQVAKQHGVAWDDDFEARFLERYESVLTAVLHERDGRVLPGVVGLLDVLAEENVAQGLGTGNFKRAAFVKLNHYGIGEYFLDGGFGEDSGQRPELLAAGLDRMRAHAAPDADCVVIGDTVHDVTAGKAIGAKTVAVKTGFGDQAELVDSQPDVLLDDLSDLDQALTAVLS